MPDPIQLVLGKFEARYGKKLTSLSNANHIPALHNGGDGELLNGGRVVVACQLDILQHDGVQTGILEGVDGIDLDRAFLFDLDAFDASRC